MNSQSDDKELDALFHGSYELIRVIGRGANSVVYHARNIHSHTQTGLSAPEYVALKILTPNPKAPGENVSRIEREVFALLACRHENVVQLYDHYATAEMSYLALEVAERGDLRRLINRRDMTVAPEVSLALITQILTGLEAIHSVGIVHRDLKPENILLTEDGRAKISDFGIASLPLANHQLQDPSRSAGTFDYLAPEFLETGESSPLTDLYSVGITCYQLLTRAFPFEGATLTERIQRKMVGQRIPLTMYVRNASLELQNIVDRSLAPNPKHRFQSAGEFREALQLYLFELGGTGSRHITVQVTADKGALERHAARQMEADSGWVQPTAGRRELKAAPKQPRRWRLWRQRQQAPRPLPPTPQASSTLPPPAPSTRESKFGLIREEGEKMTVLNNSALVDLRQELGFAGEQERTLRRTFSAIAKGTLLIILLFFAALNHEALLTIFQQGREVSTTSESSGRMNRLLTSWVIVRDDILSFFAIARTKIAPKSISAYPELYALTEGTFAGVLQKFDGRRKGVSFSVRGRGDDRLAITVDLPGWDTQLIDLRQVAKSGFVILTNGEREIVLRIGQVNSRSNEVTRGTFQDLRKRTNFGPLLLWRVQPKTIGD